MITEHTAKTLPTTYFLAYLADFAIRINELIIQPLVIPFPVIMNRVFFHGIA
jgi:hypothetical protein